LRAQIPPASNQLFSSSKKVILKEKFDVIVFADESADIIKLGKPDPNSRYARYFRKPPPPNTKEG